MLALVLLPRALTSYSNLVRSPRALTSLPPHSEIGRLKNLFKVDLRGTPLTSSADMAQFNGSTFELLEYLDVKDRRTNVAIDMEDALLSCKYLETGDMAEGGIVVKALVKAVCAQFPDMNVLKNCARNADRLFPERYSSPVELRRLFVVNPADGPGVKRKKWLEIAERLAVKEAVKVKVSRSYLGAARRTWASCQPRQVCLCPCPRALLVARRLGLRFLPRHAYFTRTAPLFAHHVPPF